MKQSREAKTGMQRAKELAYRAGHTLLLVDLYGALDEHSTDSPLFEAAIALGTQPDLPIQIGRIEPAGADLLGVQGITLLAVRPDGHVGMRCDRDHLNALERYRTLLEARHP
jgi:hypothetical protein